MSAQDYTVHAPTILSGQRVLLCPSSRVHRWDTPDGGVPEDGREVKCIACPATARAHTAPRGISYAQGLLSRVLDAKATDAVPYGILLAAMQAAMDGTPAAVIVESFNQAVLERFWSAIRQAAALAPPVKCEEDGCDKPAYVRASSQCIRHYSASENDE